MVEDSSLNEIRGNLLETMDFGRAFRIFPKRLEYERILLSYLDGRPNDYAGAIRRLPLRLRRLFIHAYQAYLFNKILSERIRSGLSLVEAELGDRVCDLSLQGNLEGKPIEVDCRNLDNVNQEIRLGRMAIVLPIIGLDTSFSGGRQGQIERRIVEEEDLEGEAYRMSVMPELKAYGGHRTAMMGVSMFTRTQISEDLLNANMVMATIRFSLPKGSYATILLREFMKIENPVLAGY
jgi:tRNA pseudouridine13 synthase